MVRHPASRGIGGRIEKYMYYVYLLKSGRDGRLYIGQTNNLAERLERHNNGFVKATKNRRPLELFLHKGFETRAEAMKEEKYLKSLKGGVKFTEVIKQWGLAKW